MKRGLQFALGLLLALALQRVATAQSATVMTDKADYAPGTIVTITGSGWQPGETVTLSFVESPLIDTHPNLYATADNNGDIFNNQFSPDSHDAAITFTLTAIGNSSGLQAQTTFTDAVKEYEASITPPTDTAGHASTAYSITITNDPTSTSDLSAATINIPAGYTSVTLGTVTPPSGKTWTASVTAGVISIAATGGNSNFLTAGQAVSLALTATAPCTNGASVWTTATSGAFTLQGSQPTVTISGTCTANHFSVTLPASVTAGTPFNFSVTALTASNAVATNYTGTVHFTSSDGQAVLSANSTLTNGTRTFSSTLKTAGTQTITATDTSVGSITGSGSTTVNAATASKLVFTSAPATVTAGVCSGALTVQSQDSVGNPSNVTSTETLTPSASPSAGASFFTNNTCTTAVTASNLTIPSGSNSATLFFKDTTAGSPVITVAGTGAFAANGANAATQTETVSASVVRRGQTIIATLFRDDRYSVALLE